MANVINKARKKRAIKPGKKKILLHGAAHQQFLKLKRETGLFKSPNKKLSQKPFSFYAMVRIGTSSKIPAAVRGREGLIVGRVKTKAGSWNYSVCVRDIEDSYYLSHTALTPTGVILKRTDLYGGEKLRVYVDERGAGTEVHIEAAVIDVQKA